MMSSVGRPKEHGDEIAAALLTAAERTIEERGIDALSVRGVASEVGTTTRAVYSVFGSKDGLLAALGTHAFNLLREGVDGIPRTDDPRGDLIAAGMMFRRFATEHPSLFALGIQRQLPLGTWRHVTDAAQAAFQSLMALVARLEEPQLLGERTVSEAALEFHALCEGLAAVELRRMAPTVDAERSWRQGLTALVEGFALSAERTSG
jgi:AcrR family transcriptional regulator